MSKLETNTIDTISGTNTLQVGDGNVATINLGKSGDTINIPSGATITNSGTANNFGGANTPAFFAYSASSQNVNYTRTKATLGTEVFDTAGAFASSRFTVPSGQDGKYFIYGSLKGEVGSDNDLLNVYANIYKNGSNAVENRIDFGTNGGRSCTNTVQVVLDLDAGDYIELYGLVQTASTQASFNNEGIATNLGGYKIIE